MRELAERAYFFLCLAMGRGLRAGRYSKTEIVARDGRIQVRKRRLFYAPLLVWLGGPLVRILNTGVTVLPQQEWRERERELYRSLHGASIRIDESEMLELPHLEGETLANLLENPQLDEPARKRAIELAVVALAEFHARGFTHGDAMAENVMVDLEAGTAHLFDFETIHDSNRSRLWCRADDVRAMAATCLLRTDPADFAETLQLILDLYADEQVTRLVADSFSSVLRRPLTFHLGQAGLAYQDYREIARLLRERVGANPVLHSPHRGLFFA